MPLSQSLVIFTVEFPYGTYETSFLKNEIAILSERFKKIYIFPSFAKGEPLSLPKNVVVVKMENEFKFSLIQYLLFALISIIVLLKEFIHCPNKRFFISNFKEQIVLLKKFFRNALIIKRKLLQLNLKTALLYSYWFDEWATILCLAKFVGIKNKLITRAHGFDLYNERHKKGFIYFRHFQLKLVDKVYLISSDGYKYFNKHYPLYRFKAEISRLGTLDYGYNPINSNGIFTIVSCSNFAPVKRVYLIPEILKYIKLPVRWVHIGGDGSDTHLVEQAFKTLPPNIEAHLLGELDHERVIKFYQENEVNLFLNVSYSEGLPVSIMEAISFGIPIIATDVGGVSEIVNEKTGLLIPKDFSPQIIGQKIMDLMKTPSFNTIERRSEIKNFWKENYSAECNYNEFYNSINSGNEDE